MFVDNEKLLRVVIRMSQNAVQFLIVSLARHRMELLSLQLYREFALGSAVRSSLISSPDLTDPTSPKSCLVTSRIYPALVHVSSTSFRGAKGSLSMPFSFSQLYSLSLEPQGSLPYLPTIAFLIVF